MNALVCELCSSNDIVKQDGFYVCRHCGTKYSPEEAKKLMVVVDNSGSIENYLSIAKAALDANNNAEAEAYCNKVLEIDDSNYEAWLIKGKAAGWQSTLAKTRIDEAINCFAKAVDNAPADAVEDVKAEVASETTSLIDALISLSCNHFAEFATKDAADTVVASALMMQRIFEALLEKCGAEPYDINSKLSTKINNAAMDGWNNHICPDYNRYEHPSKPIWQSFIERGDAVILLLNTALNLQKSADTGNTATYYSNLISVQSKLISSGAWNYDSGWHIEWKLSDNAISNRTNAIKQWHEKWHEIDPSHAIPDYEAIAKSEKKYKTISCIVATICTVFLLILFHWATTN